MPLDQYHILQNEIDPSASKTHYLEGTAPGQENSLGQAFPVPSGDSQAWDTEGKHVRVSGA